MSTFTAQALSTRRYREERKKHVRLLKVEEAPREEPQVLQPVPETHRGVEVVDLREQAFDFVERGAAVHGEVELGLVGLIEVKSERELYEVDLLDHFFSHYLDLR